MMIWNTYLTNQKVVFSGRMMMHCFRRWDQKPNDINQHLDQNDAWANTELRFGWNKVGSLCGLFGGVENAGNPVGFGQQSSVNNTAENKKSFTSITRKFLQSIGFLGLSEFKGNIPLTQQYWPLLLAKYIQDNRKIEYMSQKSTSSPWQMLWSNSLWWERIS